MQSAEGMLTSPLHPLFFSAPFSVTVPMHFAFAALCFGTFGLGHVLLMHIAKNCLNYVRSLILTFFYKKGVIQRLLLWFVLLKLVPCCQVWVSNTKIKPLGVRRSWLMTHAKAGVKGISAAKRFSRADKAEWLRRGDFYGRGRCVSAKM